MSREFRFLTKKHVFMIHEQTIKVFGGEPGYYDHTNGSVEGIISQQYPLFGFDKYPSVFQKAAMLIYFFIKGHCFVDGNKRVGIQAAIVFLDVNGFEDKLDDAEGYQKAMEIASSSISEDNRDSYIDQLAEWLSQRFTPKENSSNHSRPLI